MALTAKSSLSLAPEKIELKASDICVYVCFFLPTAWDFLAKMERYQTLNTHTHTHTLSLTLSLSISYL